FDSQLNGASMADPFVRPDVRQFLDYLNNLPGPKSHEVGPNEARTMMLASRHVADAPVGELALIRDLSCPGPAGDIKLRLYDARESRGAGPLILFFHGGGFVLGDLDTHEPFCAEMVRAVDLPVLAEGLVRVEVAEHEADRKSTRLNSSHDQISYAVF